MGTAKTVLSASEALGVLNSALSASKKTTETVFSASSDAASQGYQQAMTFGKEHVDLAVKTSDAALARCENLLDLSKESADAVMASGSQWVKGLQGLAQSMVDFVHSSIEDAVAHSQAAASVKSVRELVQLQRSFARSGLEKTIAEGTRLSEDSLRLVEAVSTPLSRRVEKTVQELVKPVAL